MKGLGAFLKLGFFTSSGVFLLLINKLSIAAVAPDVRNAAIGTASPSTISKTLSSKPISAPNRRATPAAEQKEEPASRLGPQAAQIKFHLAKIIIEGNRAFNEQQLRSVYKDQLNTNISVADLEKIVQSITNFYRNNGYILSRAVLPPQHVANGIVHIRVLEGYIDEAQVQGEPKRAKYLLQKYGDNITKSKPLQIRVMEHYLRIANEIPGMTTRAVLEPSKKQIGSSIVNLISKEKTLSGYISYDNYGTRYVGPNQFTANISANSIFQSGDSTHLTMVRTTRPLELQYIDFSHEIPIGGNGLRTTFGANSSRTRPGASLRAAKIDGDSVTFYGNVSYPLIRARDQDLTLDGGIASTDSGTNTFDDMLYNDHIRSFRFGGNYDFADRFYGSNSMAAHIEHGFDNLFGASDNTLSPEASRYGADGKFTKINANYGRLQSLFWRLSSFFYITGQYSFNPLLSPEQFTFGGSQLGRGYDSAEIIGDKGVGASAEIRLDTAPGWMILQSAQPYVFYDAGIIWNFKNVQGSTQKSTANSAGIGVRLYFNKNVFGNFMIAQPLTRQVSALQAVGESRRPRGFFSITLTG